MTDTAGVRVESTGGTTHAGTGNLYNNNYIFMGPRPDDSGGHGRRRRVAEDQAIWRRRVLVAPHNMGQARRLLADTGTVILDGAPGTGRTCTAHVLLREHRQDTGVLHELQPEENELPLHDPDLVGSGDQLLLDLSRADNAQWERACRDLPALRKTVHDRHAHLVVVMPHRLPLDSDLQHYRVVLTAPDALSVLRRHLRVHGLPPSDYMQPHGAVTEFLQGRPMREIAAFADLIRRAREADPDKNFTHWCDKAVTARGDLRRKAANKAAGLRQAPQRALLVTAAMLHGAHADLIYRAVQILLEITGSPPEQLPLLEHKDLAERFHEIGAESDARGRVRFSDLDDDQAVRTHFWDHVPGLRPHLDTWTLQLVNLSDRHMTEEVRSDLVARLAAQYLRTGRNLDLVFLAENWAASPATRLSRQAAVQALACGLNDAGQGARFRQLIYHWCAERRPRGDFTHVLIEVCAEVIAATHPDQALIRLHHLARRERSSARALQALDELVASSRPLRRLLLHRLARSEPTLPDLAIFLQISDPEPLTQPGATTPLVHETGVRLSLTACWHAVLGTLPRTQWHPHAERWLHHVAREEQNSGEVLLDVLVGAAQRCQGRSGSVFAALYASARDAERSADGQPQRSAATTELLLSKIRAAQGLGPTISATASARGSRP
ncbi:hypothetical protein SAMN05216223_11669 [Actinacidiphila yanglinensis]|uniref:Uncharacterized protein n=1 Tax=Actinacidiphila yanglinensis TaxID=310779 RepID=A0A1H6DJ13_9ACTN|nr:hypothetical protein [Actinacidiphila yanglinensis]SEG85457.1 hypothetical protein SAMN05216223_11669 [Actinacidiphila yanglinensis]